MKIILSDDPGVCTFAQLYTHTLRLLAAQPRHDPKTIVLGPMNTTYVDNIERMQQVINCLSEDGWQVLDLVSFQPVVDRLITSLCIQGYPFTVLEDFTLPLLRSGWFPTVHFMPDYEHSVGALREYHVACEERLRIIEARVPA